VGVIGKRSYGKATIPLFLYRGGGTRTTDLSVPNCAAVIHSRNGVYQRYRQVVSLSYNYGLPALFVTGSTRAVGRFFSDLAPLILSNSGVRSFIAARPAILPALLSRQPIITIGCALRRV